MKFPDTISITLPAEVFEHIHAEKNAMCDTKFVFRELSTPNEEIMHFLIAVVTSDVLTSNSEDAELFYWVLALVFPNKAIDLVYDATIPLIYQLLEKLHGFVEARLLEQVLAQFTEVRRLNYK